MIIKIDGNKWQIERTKCKCISKFELNKEFNLTNRNGHTVTAMFMFVDGKLIYVEKVKSFDDDSDTTAVCSIENGKLVMVCIFLTFDEKALFSIFTPTISNKPTQFNCFS
jgi:hypothetical protein